MNYNAAPVGRAAQTFPRVAKTHTTLVQRHHLSKGRKVDEP